MVGLVEEAIKKEEDKAELDERLEEAVMEIVKVTAAELSEEAGNLEKKMKRAVLVT